MRRRHSYIAVMLIGVATAMTLIGCGKADENNIKPGDYIELGQYKGLEITKPSGEVSEEDVEDELNYLANAFAEEQVLTEGVIENGDVANIDYEGKRDGVAFEGGTAQGYDLTIGSHMFIDGFEDGLIGKSIGDTVDLNLTFPENYGMSDLAGADVVFTVTINSAKRYIAPEITDELIEKISQGEYDNVADYKVALEEQIRLDNAEYAEQQLYSDLLNMAVDNATIIKDIPNDFVQAKIARLLLNAQDYANAYGVDFATFLEEHMQMTEDEYNAQSVEYAKKAAKQSLVLMAIADAEGIEVTEEELNKGIDDYVKMYNYSDRDEFISSTNMDDFKEYILTSKIEEFLYDNAIIK